MDNETTEKDSEFVHPKMAQDIFVWTFSVLGSKDRVSQVLRLHALTEYYLDRLLSLHLRNPDPVTENGRFTYSHKRAVVEALGVLPKGVIESLKRLTKLRNKCAHSPFPKITDEDIENAAEPIRDAFQTTLSDHKKDGLETG